MTRFGYPGGPPWIMQVAGMVRRWLQVLDALLGDRI